MENKGNILLQTEVYCITIVLEDWFWFGNYNDTSSNIYHIDNKLDIYLLYQNKYEENFILKLLSAMAQNMLVLLASSDFVTTC